MVESWLAKSLTYGPPLAVTHMEMVIKCMYFKTYTHENGDKMLVLKNTIAYVNVGFEYHHPTPITKFI